MVNWEKAIENPFDFSTSLKLDVPLLDRMSNFFKKFIII